MKRLAFFLTYFLTFALTLTLFALPVASAAPKTVAVKKLNLLAVNQGTEEFVISGKTIVTIGNSEGANSNVLLTGLDSNGVQLWQKIIDSGADEVALAATTDSLGNIWLAGASAPLVASDTATAPVQAENPDGVVMEPSTKLRGDMNLLTIWKISATGDVVTNYTSALAAPALINAISANNSGASIAGIVQEKPFIESVNSLGVFGKPTFIGTANTSLNAIVRHTDGSVSVFGSSSETLGGKKLVGKRDGVLIRVSKNGAIASVVRSSAPKADRSWISADNSLALTGYVKTGKIVETAFTKFTSAFAPTWTMRVPSLGTSAIVSAGTTIFGAFSSNNAVTGVSGWRPTAPSVLLLAFDAKGVIANAYGSSEILEPISLAYSKDLGLIGLARTAQQTLTLFKIS